MASGLGLPRRLAASVAHSIDAVGELPLFQQWVLEHLDSMDREMGALNDSMTQKLDETKAVMLRIERHIAMIAERTPDPDAPGRIAKAREAITGGE